MKKIFKSKILNYKIQSQITMMQDFVRYIHVLINMCARKLIYLVLQIKRLCLCRAFRIRWRSKPYPCDPKRNFGTLCGRNLQGHLVVDT